MLLMLFVNSYSVSGNNAKTASLDVCLRETCTISPFFEN